MLPKRIILEGKSYLMLEENLGRLQYSPFKPGSINAKHYSDYEPITLVGIAHIDTVTRKRLDKKNVEVQDLKFAIKFQWDVDTLASNPDLFMRYYNYFESAPQTNDGKKGNVASSTVTDFMPFINDSVYSKTFQSAINGDDEFEDDSTLMEAAGKKKKPAPEGTDVEKDLEDNLASFDDAFTDTTDVEDAETAQVMGADEINLDKNSEDITRSKATNYYFYLVFKYDEKYDHSAKMKNAAFNDAMNIEIIKLVSESHADNSNVAITGRVLEKRAIGFYRELLGILNANHATIISAVSAETKELGMDMSEIPTDNAEVDFDPNRLPGEEDVTLPGDFEDPTAGVSSGEIPESNYDSVQMANASLRNDQIANIETKSREMQTEQGRVYGDLTNDSNASEARTMSFNRFKQAFGG